MLKSLSRATGSTLASHKLRQIRSDGEPDIYILVQKIFEETRRLSTPHRSDTRKSTTKTLGCHRYHCRTTSAHHETNESWNERQYLDGMIPVCSADSVV